MSINYVARTILDNLNTYAYKQKCDKIKDKKKTVAGLRSKKEGISLNQKRMSQYMSPPIGHKKKF